MDPRPPRPPSERTLVHNPNHQPSQSSKPSHFAAYSPASQQHPQPPVHIPFTADPYRRDPFLPASAHHARRSSYGVHGEGAHTGPDERHGSWGNTGNGQGAHLQQQQQQHLPHHLSNHHHVSGPPPPPSMTGSQYVYEAPRRQSHGGASPNNPYGAPAHDPPPPPPSYGRPHMPPPSSPQQQHSHAPQSQRPPFASAFGGGRELPGPGLGHRPGSSMSISSIMGGGDTGAPTQTPQSQLSTPGGPTNAPAPSHHSMQPPSPRRNLSSGSRPELQPFRRQPSPDRHMYSGGMTRGPEGHGYPGGSPTRSYNPQPSPEQGRQSLPQTAQPYKPMVFQASRPYASSPSETHARVPRQAPPAVPPRPSSQPQNPLEQPGHDGRMGYEIFGGRRAVYGPPEERRRTLGDSQHSRPNVTDILGGPSQQHPTDRDRPVTVQPVSRSPFSPPRDPRSLSGPIPHARSLWRHSAPEDAPRESTEVRREEPPALYRGYGVYTASTQAPAPYGHYASEDMVRGRSLDHLNNRVIEQYHAPPTSDPHSHERLKAEQLTRSLSSGGSAYPSRSMYDQRRMGEEMHNKALALGGPEANRRTGRASPLPQAVQGAQAQPVSIGKDPSIKSEFGRMFSGLGSGLGSSTPSRQSPMPQGIPENLPAAVDLNDLRPQRVNSSNGRRSKRVKDEEGMPDNESIDGRITPTSRGLKRNKHAHPGHHHHHHVHAHYHHHHHQKPDEDVPPHMPSATATPLTGRYSVPPPNGTASHHHHHHHHAAPHHHHHAPRPAQVPSPKLSTKVHDIQSVLDKAAGNARQHLGSYLYEAVPELPKPNSSLDDQFCYASKPKPLPVFDRNPVNCIVTCRVHRYYLKPRQRQQIVLQRHLWGAEIYRDDSDPLAAAMHSGWIRGEWDDTVDVNMLDPRITAPNDPSDAAECLVKRPAAPVTPPAEMELQIDLLILPRLEKYEGSVEYGISSRKSAMHDGLSFKIHQIRWVEEGVGSRGQERTAAAMKRRLDASRALLSLTNGGGDVLRTVNGTTKLHA